MKKIVVLLVAALMFLFPVPAGGLPASDPGHTPCSVQKNCPALPLGMKLRHPAASAFKERCYV